MIDDPNPGETRAKPPTSPEPLPVCGKPATAMQRAYYQDGYVQGYRDGATTAASPTPTESEEADCCDTAMRERLNVNAASLNKELCATVATLTRERDSLREALGNLRMGDKDAGGCWCIESPTRTSQPDWKHTKECKAATAALATPEENQDDHHRN